MMTNEELKAKIESIKCFDDAYKMACEGGYKGTIEEFAALVERAADEMPMDMEAMDSVAGGGFKDVVSSSWDAVSGAFSNAADWVKNNAALTAEIAGGVALVGVAVGASVYAYRSYKRNHNDIDGGKLVQIGDKWYADQGKGKLVFLEDAY